MPEPTAKETSMPTIQINNSANENFDLAIYSSFLCFDFLNVKLKSTKLAKKEKINEKMND